MHRISTIVARAALAAFFSAIGAWFGHANAVPLSSAITYQGELYDEGMPFNGEVDLRFTPYADGSNPNLLGAPIVVENQLVSNGVFTTRLDFGAGFFVGDAVFLEIAVRPADSGDPGAFEVLTPRQEITAAPYSLKPAPGSVTDIELAADAVGAAQVADGSIAGTDVADASLTPADLALAGGAFDTTFWRVGGNAGTAGATLGPSDNQPLSLVSPVGVTINGARRNNNTELTIRGNPNTAENNADLTLWPRNGEAFFNFAVAANPSNAVATPANTYLLFNTVGTNPTTSYVSRAIMAFDGSFGVGGADPTPQARLHVSRVDLGFDAADSTEQLEIVIEDADAQLALYSSPNGSGGSVISLAEMDEGALTNQWGLYRATSGAGSRLFHTFGTGLSAAGNPPVASFATDGGVAFGLAANHSGFGSFTFADSSSSADFGPTGAFQFVVRATGGLAINGAPGVGSNELTVHANSSSPGTAADLVLQPGGGGNAYRIAVQGSNGAMFFYALDPDGAEPVMPRLYVNNEGDFALNPATPGGGFQINSFPLRVGTLGNTANGNGAHVTNGGVWTNGSSRAFKEAFTAIDAGDVLRRVLALPVMRWRYKNEKSWHLGPVAEEFRAAFGLGEDEQYIGTVDADGVALAAIQGLHARTEARADALARENEALRSKLDALAARIEALERAE